MVRALGVAGIGLCGLVLVAVGAARGIELFELFELFELQQAAAPPPAAPERPARPAPGGQGRAASPAERAPADLVIVAGGDVNLGRHVGQRLLAEPDYDPLSGVARLFRQADIAFVNLESPLSHQGGQTRHPTEHNAFTGPPSGADALAAAGVDVVSVANNHAWDYGLEGFVQTLDHLAVAGIGAVGASALAGRQYEARVLESKGLSVAILAGTDVWNPGELETHEGGAHVASARSGRFIDAVRRAARRFDVVIASVHAGREYLTIPEPVDRALLEDVARAGATVVVGHHPHIVQGVSWVGGAAVLHSLGNLVFGVHRSHPWTGRTVLARLTVTPHPPRPERPASRRGADTPRPVRVALDLCPIVILHDEPHPIEAVGLSHEVELYRGRLRDLSAPLGGAEVGPVDADGCFAVGPLSHTQVEAKLFASAADDHGRVDQAQTADGLR